MKKYALILILTIVMSFFTGCANKTNMANVEIEGSFSVIVRDIIPDYCLDDFTPQVAVVTEFQSSPYTVHLGEELASQIEIGKAYVFTIQPKEIGELSEKLLDDPVNPVEAINRYHLTVKSIRPAGDDEWGLESPSLEYRVIE